MPVIDCVVSTPVLRTPRLLQLAGLFDVPLEERSVRRWSAHLPLEERDWSVGLIVGPSGCGKTTIARNLFGDRLDGDFAWPADTSLLEGFPSQLGIKQITALLSSVGFSSPPSWLRPFRCLSNGEQFRATVARTLAEQPDLAVIDEFTSVVDRTVAQIGCAAVAKAVRRAGNRLVAVSCHFDIADWLAPDWTYEPATDTFHWRSERRRPPIDLQIRRVHQAAWQLFKPHHYLTGVLNSASLCFVATLDNQPAAFCAAQSFPHPIRPAWREHRLVCLPDFQGVGIGHALSEFVASLFAVSGKPYLSNTSSPAMIGHRCRSPLWIMHRKPQQTSHRRGNAACRINAARRKTRIMAGFTYIGPGRPEEAAAFGVPIGAKRRANRCL